MFLAIAAFLLSLGPATQPASAVTAKGYERLLISGLDGAQYTRYRPATIQWVQKALKERGLYTGPVNGILDWPTKKAIYAFQEANKLQRCGVPTPHTRKM